MKKKEQKITKHDAIELMNFKAWLAYNDHSADLKDVLRRLQTKWNLENVAE